VPAMVREGRQILRNLQRVARLFVTKSAFAAFLILSIGLTPLAYPLLPRHLTLAASLAVGIPGFFLALAPSSGRLPRTSFLRDVGQFAVPAGAAAGLGVLSSYLFSSYVLQLGLVEARTVATTVLILVGLYLIIVLIFSVASGLYSVVTMFALSLSGPVEWLVGVVATLGGLALVGWLFVRLTLAGPVAVADERLDIRGAWMLTRGEFWRLVATLLLSILFYGGVLLLALVFSLLSTRLLGGFSLLGELSQPSASHITQGEALAGIGLIVLQQAIITLLIVLWVVVFCAAPARVLQQIRGAAQTR